MTRAESMRMIRVAKGTYAVAGFTSALALFACVGCLNEGAAVSGVVAGMLGVGVFVHLCFQRIFVCDGRMVMRRPLLPSVEISLRRVSKVRTQWWELYRRFALYDGERVICSFNPKLFSLQDLRFILGQIKSCSPAVIFDEDTAAFLPATSNEPNHFPLPTPGAAD